MSDQAQFFKFFASEVNDLQDRMKMLETLTPFERTDAIDFCLAGIANLTSSVKDASSYLPAYDQRTYGDAIKRLSDTLQNSRASLAPRKKFAFKSGDYPRKNASALSVADAAALVETRLQASNASSLASSIAPTPLELSLPGTPVVEASTDAVGPAKDTVVVSERRGEYITLSSLPELDPSTISTITLSNLEDCVVDLRFPPSPPPRSSTSTSTSSASPAPTEKTVQSKPLAALYLKSLTSTLLILPPVAGSAHLTSLTNCTLVLSCHQFRMHDSSVCRIHLFCPSHPIIEDCTGLGFAPLVEGALGEDGEGGGEEKERNRWDEVDDFKWLKEVGSPNWGVLSEDQRLTPDVLERMREGGPWRTMSARQMLEAAGGFFEPEERGSLHSPFQ